VTPLRWVAVALLTALTLLAGVAGWLIGTRSGAAWLLARVDARLEALELGSVHGTLAGRLRLHDVRYRDPAGGGAFFNFSDGLAVAFCP